MSNNKNSLQRRALLILSITLILALLLIQRAGYSKTEKNITEEAVLQASIQITSMTPIPGDQPEKFQPGSPVKIAVSIENKGKHPSPEGDLFVRFAFAHPLHTHKGSVIFQTEKKFLPSIEGDKAVVIQFDTPHKLTSLLDFVRDDWSIREYQAVAVINQKEYVVGTLAITFSAYYYPGMAKEVPAEVGK